MAKNHKYWSQNSQSQTHHSYWWQHVTWSRKAFRGSEKKHCKRIPLSLHQSLLGTKSLQTHTKKWSWFHYGWKKERDPAWTCLLALWVTGLSPRTAPRSTPVEGGSRTRTSPCAGEWAHAARRSCALLSKEVQTRWWCWWGGEKVSKERKGKKLGMDNWATGKNTAYLPRISKSSATPLCLSVS